VAVSTEDNVLLGHPPCSRFLVRASARIARRGSKGRTISFVCEHSGRDRTPRKGDRERERDRERKEGGRGNGGAAPRRAGEETRARVRDIADTHLRSRALISSTHITRPREQMLTSVEPEPPLPPFPVVASRHSGLGRTDGRTDGRTGGRAGGRADGARRRLFERVPRGQSPPRRGALPPSGEATPTDASRRPFLSRAKLRLLKESSTSALPVLALQLRSS